MIFANLCFFYYNKFMKKIKFSLKTYIEQVVIASIYVALTLIIRPIGFFQIRLSEALLFLLLFDKRHLIGLSFGCFVANFFSEFALFDIIFGTGATIISGIWLLKLKDRYFICLLYPIFINGLTVGIMLNLILDLNLELSILSVMISEGLTLYFISVPLYYFFKNNIFLNDLVS